jgi:hypothetical protein
MDTLKDTEAARVFIHVSKITQSERDPRHLLALAAGGKKSMQNRRA